MQSHTYIVTDLDTGIACSVQASQVEIQRIVDSEAYSVISITMEPMISDGKPGVLSKIAVLNESNEDPIAEGRIQPDGSLVVTDGG